jgi:hypothetical protein
MLSCQNKTTDNKHTSSTQAEIESEKIDNSNDNVSNQLSPNHDFENFKVDLYEGTLADPDFNTAPEAKQFITRITEACANGINFAGKYTLVIWGCGTSCQSGVVVDRTNGKIYEGYYSSLGSEFKKDSRMIIINSGLIDETTNVIDDQNMVDLSVELWNGSEFIKANN